MFSCLGIITGSMEAHSQTNQWQDQRLHRPPVSTASFLWYPPVFPRIWCSPAVTAELGAPTFKQNGHVRRCHLCSPVSQVQCPSTAQGSWNSLMRPHPRLATLSTKASLSFAGLGLPHNYILILSKQ